MGLSQGWLALLHLFGLADGGHWPELSRDTVITGISGSGLQYLKYRLVAAKKPRPSSSSLMLGLRTRKSDDNNVAEASQRFLFGLLESSGFG
jgi:hypothetical protein